MTVPSPALTTVPSVRAALVTRLSTLVFTEGDAAPVVSYGDPGRDIADRFVAVASAEDHERSIRRLPHDLHSSVDEDYVMQVVLWSLVRNRNDGDAQRQAVEDVYGWAQRIDLHLRGGQEAWTLGGLVTWCVVKSLEAEDFTLAEGRASQITVRLEVKAARI